MVSIMNINNGIKESLICGGYVKVRESVYIQITIWVRTILNHIEISAILPKYEGSCMVYRPEWY